MARPIVISDHKRMTLEVVDNQLQVRMQYNTKKDPEFKPASGGFNMAMSRKEIKQWIKQLKAICPEE